MSLMFIITWVGFFLEHYLYQTSKNSSIINENRSEKNGFRMLLSLRSYDKPTCWGVLDLFSQRSGLLSHSPPHVWVNKGATTDKSVNSKYCYTQVSHLKVLQHTSQSPQGATTDKSVISRCYNTQVSKLNVLQETSQLTQITATNKSVTSRGYNIYVSHFKVIKHISKSLQASHDLKGYNKPVTSRCYNIQVSNLKVLQQTNQ